MEESLNRDPIAPLRAPHSPLQNVERLGYKYEKAAFIVTSVCAGILGVAAVPLFFFYYYHWGIASVVIAVVLAITSVVLGWRIELIQKINIDMEQVIRLVTSSNERVLGFFNRNRGNSGEGRTPTQRSFSPMPSSSVSPELIEPAQYLPGQIPSA